MIISVICSKWISILQTHISKLRITHLFSRLTTITQLYTEIHNRLQHRVSFLHKQTTATATCMVLAIHFRFIMIDPINDTCRVQAIIIFPRIMDLLMTINKHHKISKIKPTNLIRCGCPQIHQQVSLQQEINLMWIKLSFKVNCITLWNTIDRIQSLVRQTNILRSSLQVSLSNILYTQVDPTNTQRVLTPEKFNQSTIDNHHN